MSRVRFAKYATPEALRVELEITADASRTTLLSRAAIAFLGSAMLAAVTGAAVAAAWLGLLCALEAAVHLLAKHAPREGRGARWSAVLFIGLLALIACAWSVGPVCFWRTGRAPLQFAGMAILVAQLVDVQCHAFRQRVASLILGGVPALLFVTLPLQAALSRDAQRSETGILAFCLASTLFYFIVAVKKNRSASEALDDARTQAQAASHAKSAFIAMISHELRTPMNGVIGLAHALKTSPSRAEREQQTDSIIRSGETLMSLLNDVLDLSKVEAGKMALEPSLFDPQGLVADLAALWSPLAQAKGLKFQCNLKSQRAVWLCGDADRLRQVLSNLISNAIKFTARGSVTLQVSLDEGPEGRMALVAQVSDTGTGISDAEKAHLFKPFSQARASVSRQFGGTGLGLAISRGLVELMGGSLSITSRPGFGSMFELRLILPVADAPVASVKPSPALVQDRAQAHILVVDDNAINLQVATALLGGLGATTATASSGDQALAMLSNGGFDLVLLDIHMPGMSGLETLRRIRGGNAETADVAVVACTADAMTESLAQLLAEGFDAVQPKPIVPKALADTLGPLLSRPRLAKAQSKGSSRGDCASAA